MIKQTGSAGDWWQTGIVDIEPGSIRLRGYPIEQLIGRASFVDMIWLMLRGELPAPHEAHLLEAALVAAVDHGPLAPSIAVARMAATCGLGINGAMASAINTLGDVHGGAGQQALELMIEISEAAEDEAAIPVAAAAMVDRRVDDGQIVPGFGHRLHPVDPRSGRLLELVDVMGRDGLISGRFAAIGRGIEARLAQRKGGAVPMNIDGATAVIYGELGFPAALARGLFVLSRSVGILAHAYEQTEQGGRIKGPLPLSEGYAYTGPARRDVPDEGQPS